MYQNIIGISNICGDISNNWADAALKRSDVIFTMTGSIVDGGKRRGSLLVHGFALGRDKVDGDGNFILYIELICANKNGKRLLREVEKYAATHGYLKVLLCSIVEPFGFYEHMGYTLTRDCGFEYYTGDKEGGYTRSMTAKYASFTVSDRDSKTPRTINGCVAANDNCIYMEKIVRTGGAGGAGGADGAGGAGGSDVKRTVPPSVITKIVTAVPDGTEIQIRRSPRSFKPRRRPGYE